MELMEAILTRRSIRKFTSKVVSKDLINDLLRAAMQAPSAGNRQSWNFIVLTDRKIINKIPEFHPYAKMLLEAPLAILVSAEVKTEDFCGYWIQDCSAATQNLLLAAHAKGLGAVWLGMYPRQERVEGIRKILNLPIEIVPLSLVAIGYPGEKKEPENRFKEEKIHYNKW